MNAKLQFTGLAAMFKIIFPKDDEIVLTENELVGFINLAHRLSNTVRWYKEWREYEEQEAFYKTVLFAAISGLIILLFIIAILLCFRKTGEKEEDKVPLRNKTDQPS